VASPWPIARWSSAWSSSCSSASSWRTHLFHPRREVLWSWAHLEEGARARWPPWFCVWVCVRLSVRERYICRDTGFQWESRVEDGDVEGAKSRKGPNGREGHLGVVGSRNHG
jgi:hypothetical protein